MKSYQFLTTEKKDNYIVVTMNRGKSNPLNLPILLELHDCFDMLLNDKQTQGVILSGQEGFFSVGVDVIDVFGYSENDTRAFWKALMGIMIKLANFPKPYIASITGHSPAGGCVLAIPADYRVMAEGKYTIGLNEIPLGISVPDIFFHMYAFWLGTGKAYQYLLDGKLLTVAEALSAGLVDEACPANNVPEYAEAKMRHYLKIIPAVFQQSKMNFRKELLGKLDVDLDAIIASFVGQWHSKDTQATIKGLIDSLKK